MKQRKVKTTISKNLLQNVAKGLAANLVRTSKTNKQQFGYPVALNPFQSALSKIMVHLVEKTLRANVLIPVTLF